MDVNKRCEGRAARAPQTSKVLPQRACVRYAAAQFDVHEKTMGHSTENLSDIDSSYFLGMHLYGSCLFTGTFRRPYDTIGISRPLFSAAYTRREIREWHPDGDTSIALAGIRVACTEKGNISRDY